MNRYRLTSASLIGVIGVMVAMTTVGASTSANFGFGISDFGFSRHSEFTARPLPNPKSKIQNLKSGQAWINLPDGHEVPTAYLGTAGLVQVLEQILAQPTALASADFDEDGVPDLICGYVSPSGGIVTLHRGNVEALFPRTQDPRLKTQDLSPLTRSPAHPLTPSPFHPEAGVFELLDAPEFLGAGDFDADGHWDVVAAARGGHVLHLLPGDGRGGFHEAKQVPLPGAVTALITGEINRRDGLEDVVVGIVGPDDPQVLVFEGPGGALRGVAQTSVCDASAGRASAGRTSPTEVCATPEVFPLPAPATALALGQLDDGYEMDLAVGAGSELVIVHGRDRKLPLDEIRYW
jgi:hypothetical protein